LKLFAILLRVRYPRISHYVYEKFGKVPSLFFSSFLSEGICTPEEALAKTLVTNPEC
jgi:hypothetical protein